MNPRGDLLKQLIARRVFNETHQWLDVIREPHQAGIEHRVVSRHGGEPRKKTQPSDRGRAAKSGGLQKLSTVGMREHGSAP